jgi:D-alanyl-D-alanine carboxypeptidase
MRRIAVTGALVAVVAVVAAGCGGSDKAEGTATTPSVKVEITDKPMSDADAAAVDKMVTGVYSTEAQKAFPGFWIGIWDPQKGYFVKGYGEAEKGGAKASADDRFRIGSISKTYTATVILQLVDEGKLSLDDTVEQADPDLAQKYPEVKGITIQQLLGMRSGIPDYLNVPDGAILPKLTADPSTVFTADDLIAAGIKGGVKPPGTPGYSTTNTIILQQIAEQLTGKSIQDLVSEKVTTPLGMKTAFPAWDDATLASPGTHGYLNQICVQELQSDGGTAKDGTDTTSWNLTSSQGGGGGNSDLHDLGIWAASMSGSALLSKDLAAKRLETTTLPKDKLDYGLGIYKKGDWYGHSGEVFGWEALELHNPATGATMVMATNACAGSSLLMGLLGNMLYPGTGLGI